MPSLEDMGKSFEQEIRQESTELRTHVRNVSLEVRSYIERDMIESLSTIRNDINALTKSVGKLLLKSWLIMIISIVIGLSLAIGLNWYLGKEIASKMDIRKGLDSFGVKPTLQDGTDREYLLIPKGKTLQLKGDYDGNPIYEIVKER